MALYDHLPKGEKEKIQNITYFANLERDAFNADVRQWLMTMDERDEEYLKLHSKVKTAICKILLKI